MTKIRGETGAETNIRPHRTMSFLTRLVAYSPGLYTLATLGWVVFHLWPLVPGLLGKALFDVIEGRAPAGLTVWTLIGLTVAVGLARSAAIISATVAWAGWYQRARGLIQYNLLRRVFSRPGAQAVPGTMGESISTVRDDSDDIAFGRTYGGSHSQAQGIQRAADGQPAFHISQIRGVTQDHQVVRGEHAQLDGHRACARTVDPAQYRHRERRSASPHRRSACHQRFSTTSMARATSSRNAS